MFGFNKEEMANKEVEHMARKMMAKMMSDAILKSNAPESQKSVIRVLNKAEDIQDALHETIVNRYCTTGNEANVETLKKVLEYLQLVEVGIKQFVETTPFVPNTEEE